MQRVHGCETNFQSIFSYISLRLCTNGCDILIERNMNSWRIIPRFRSWMAFVATLGCFFFKLFRFICQLSPRASKSKDDRSTRSRSSSFSLVDLIRRAGWRDRRFLCHAPTSFSLIIILNARQAANNRMHGNKEELIDKRTVRYSTRWRQIITTVVIRFVICFLLRFPLHNSVNYMLSFVFLISCSFLFAIDPLSGVATR